MGSVFAYQVSSGNKFLLSFLTDADRSAFCEVHSDTRPVRRETIPLAYEHSLRCNARGDVCGVSGVRFESVRVL